ncbi:hypothetical protein AGR6A_pAt60242 [Agrobacterium sp. NCPPB 925]|nr:hypothetical protein AGR6A_pAt60242 [Agrobacterium sp. NCPPB 925]
MGGAVVYSMGRMDNGKLTFDRYPSGSL